MEATKCVKLCRRGQEVQLLFSPNVRMEKKSDRGMIVGARQGVKTSKWIGLIRLQNSEDVDSTQ